jgi:hypothetical protein
MNALRLQHGVFPVVQSALQAAQLGTASGNAERAAMKFAAVGPNYFWYIAPSGASRKSGFQLKARKSAPYPRKAGSSKAPFMNSAALVEEGS